MWTREALKTRGKESFKRNYWKCVLASLLLGACTAGVAASSGSSAANTVRRESAEQNLSSQLSLLSPTQMLVILVFVLGIVVITLIISTIITAFVANPVIVGGRRFYLTNRNENADISLFTYAFTSGKYGNVVITLFLKGLFLTLWSMLFFFPGAVKHYSYWMMEYILAENPSISRKRAFEISRQTMNGEKWNTFVLDLSFILWILLSCCTCGILNVFYLNSYIHATEAELYAVLREKALSQNIASIEELPGC
ncbi:MAG: DUF975 family protein [Lachnospiraceae bacterium]|nr:DUF975 family protein [Lachnospiraceae bacterium]